jgi:hypothetical protein
MAKFNEQMAAYNKVLFNAFPRDLFKKRDFPLLKAIFERNAEGLRFMESGQKTRFIDDVLLAFTETINEGSDE